MILVPGTWMGRGSFRPANDTLGVNFTAVLAIKEDDQGLLIDAELELESGQTIEAGIWVVADEYGTYSVNVRGDGLDVSGIAKLESVPHLGLLWSEDGSRHVTFAVFTLRDSFGIRGFAHDETHTTTWELALQPQQRAVIGGNIVSFDSRRKRR